MLTWCSTGAGRCSNATPAKTGALRRWPLEDAIHQRLPERGLLDILTRTAYQIGWTRHFGPPSGSDPKLADALGRYVLTAFCYGTGLGPAQIARHMRGQVSAHELARAFHQHCGPDRLQAANTDVINAFARLDVAKLCTTSTLTACSGRRQSTGGCWSSTDRTCCAPRSPSARARFPR